MKARIKHSGGTIANKTTNTLSHASTLIVHLANSCMDVDHGCERVWISWHIGETSSFFFTAFALASDIYFFTKVVVSSR